MYHIVSQLSTCVCVCVQIPVAWRPPQTDEGRWGITPLQGIRLWCGVALPLGARRLLPRSFNTASGSAVNPWPPSSSHMAWAALRSWPAQRLWRAAAASLCTTWMARLWASGAGSQMALFVCHMHATCMPWPCLHMHVQHLPLLCCPCRVTSY